MASLEKSRNSLQTGVGVEPLFMLRCDRSPVMLTLITAVERVLSPDRNAVIRNSQRYSAERGEK
jgi:hypothetical protein